MPAALQQPPFDQTPQSPGGVRCSNAVTVTLSLLLALVFVWTLLLDFLPPLEKDALIHHLAIPKLWLKAGGFIETPWADFSYYPMNLELLYLVPLALGADWGAKLIHNAFGLATAGLIFYFLRRRLGRNWGLAGALLFLSTPMVMRLAVSAYVDLGLAFFMTAALLSLIRWDETGRTGPFVLSAVCLGLGLGVKYNALIALPLLGLAVFYIRNRSAGGLVRPALWGCLYLALAGLVFAPWLVKNLVLTGNPLYPLFNGFFGLPSAVAPELQLDLFTIRRLAYGESFREVLLIPIRFFFQGRDFSPQYFDGVLNPALILLPPLALIRPRERCLRPLALFAGFWILAAFFRSSSVVRYVLPIAPVLAILAVYGLADLREWLARRLSATKASALAALLLALLLSLNAVWAVNFWTRLDPWPLLSGSETREEYLTRTAAHYPVMAYINRHLPPEARILFVFAGSRGYYCDRDYFYQTWFSGEVLAELVRRSASAEEIRNGLRTMGATHLLTRDRMLVDYMLNNFSRDRLGPLFQFQNRYLKPLFQSGGFSLYEIE